MTEPKRVYISGPMTGLPDLNFPAFNLAAAMLRTKGIEAVNPAEINPDSAMSWEQCMRADIKALCDCDTLAMLPGWERSRGAHLEVHLAHRLGMRVVAFGELVQELRDDRHKVTCIRYRQTGDACDCGALAELGGKA